MRWVNERREGHRIEGLRFRRFDLIVRFLQGSEFPTAYLYRIAGMMMRRRSYFCDFLTLVLPLFISLLVMLRVNPPM